MLSQSYYVPCPLCSSLFFSSSIVITSHGEESAGLYASRAFLCLSCLRYFLSFFSSSWCHGVAAVCGSHRTFHLTFYL